jgi:glucose/mannose-6-phosphate isomerase
MKDVILNQHQQITHSLEVNKKVKVKGTFDSIILAGLGGSGHPGDLLNALGITSLPLFVHRDYDLPIGALAKSGFTHPLVICSSYSGNTEETMTAYKDARDKDLPLIVSSSGGTLKEWATRDNVPFITIDFPNMQPRHTLLAAFTGIYAALRNSGLADNIDADLATVAAMLKEKTAGLEKAGEELAHNIKGKTVVFASSDTLGFAAKNFKIQTNENAKYPAFWNTFPELNHNEMVGFSKLPESKNPNKFIVVILHDADDHPRTTTRMAVTAELYRQWGVEVVDFTAEGSSTIEKIAYAVTFGLWTTYHLALAYNIDPVPVEGVESFKKKLQEVAGSV